MQPNIYYLTKKTEIGKAIIVNLCKFVTQNQSLFALKFAVS